MLVRHVIIAVALAVCPLGVSPTDAQPPSADGNNAVAKAKSDVTSFLRQYCNRCHGKDKQEGEVAIHKLKLTSGTRSQAESWKSILDKLQSGEMPPEKEKQPSSEQREQVVSRIKQELRNAGEAIDDSKWLHPKRGNWVDHDALFSGKPVASMATRGRLWRLTGEGYQEFIQSLSVKHYLGYVRGRMRAPWELSPHDGFRDYANQHRIGESEIEHHLRNAKVVARGMMGKIYKNSGIQEFKDLVRADKDATPKQIEAAAAAAVVAILGREPTDRERKRYTNFLHGNLESFGTKGAIEQLLVAVLFHPEVMYRIELPIEGEKRAMMAPRDLARSISYALTDREPDKKLLKSLDAERLTSREEVRAHVVRMLEDGRSPRILRFFQEYFGYTKAKDVFKDEATRKEAGLRGGWQPDMFVSDTDRLIQWILEKDKNVLYELLTTSETFAATGYSREALRVRKNPDKPFDSSAQTALDIYEIGIKREQWVDDRPFEMPKQHRMGILTHPSWLIAHSTNFDNHAIGRGHWIRERLLGGKIPDVPVTVDAQLPDEPHNTLRDRMRVTRDEYCWKCHVKMDPLGLPLEQFDHFGRFRTAETVVDQEATAKNVDKNGKSRGTKYTAASLNTSGAIQSSGDSTLDGQVNDPFELMNMLAASKRVEQVFVRHAFRYFVGRNETLADGPALVAAHQAYTRNEGSMNALITSLLTSDAFLYRTLENN